MSSAAEVIANMYPTGDICSLKLYADGPVMNFEVRHFPDRTSENYIARFLKLNNKIIMEKLTLDKKQNLFFDGDVDLTEDLLHFVVRHFEQILDMHKPTLQHLSLLGPAFYEKLKDYDFQIEQITNLNSVCLETGLDIPSQLAKIQNRLNDLYISQVDTSKNLADVKQIYTVGNRLHCEYLKLTQNQLLKLKATHAIIHIGHLHEMDIIKFVQSWEHGGSKRNVEHYKWCHLETSSLNREKLFKHYGKKYYKFDKESVNVTILQRNGIKTATMKFSREMSSTAGDGYIESLEFFVNSNKSRT